MLSIPPAAVRRGDERLRRCVGIVLGRREELGDLLVAHDVGEPVGADQIEVAGRRGDRQRLDLDARLGADSARDHRAVRVLLGLLGRQPPGADELADERVIGRQLLELAVSRAVGARVADVADRDGAGRLVDEQRRDDGSHAGGRRVVERVAVDPVVRLAEELGERRLALRIRAPLLERRGGEP